MMTKKEQRKFEMAVHQLLKQANELSILCDVPVFVVIHNPNDPIKPLRYWPEDPVQFRKGIDLFYHKSKQKSGYRSRKSRTTSGSDGLTLRAEQEKRLNEHVLQCVEIDKRITINQAKIDCWIAKKVRQEPSLVKVPAVHNVNLAGNVLENEEQEIDLNLTLSVLGKRVDSVQPKNGPPIAKKVCMSDDQEPTLVRVPAEPYLNLAGKEQEWEGSNGLLSAEQGIDLNLTLRLNGYDKKIASLQEPTLVRLPAEQDLKLAGNEQEIEGLNGLLFADQGTHLNLKLNKVDKRIANVQADIIAKNVRLLCDVQGQPLVMVPTEQNLNLVGNEREKEGLNRSSLADQGIDLNLMPDEVD